MCGILGVWSETRLAGTEFRAALDLMSHRGPDDEGYLTGVPDPPTPYRGDSTASELAGLRHIDEAQPAHVLLGHRRLSIIDTSFHGHQPFADSTGRRFLVFNGELFNYVELREQLRAMGRSFQTETDTEVVLVALETWGEDAFALFNGMWALALWDSEAQTMLLARDRFGIKPLFVLREAGFFAFGSTTRALRSLAAHSFEPDSLSALRYVDSSLLNDTVRTFWNGIEELEPGSYLVYDGASVRAERYWTFTPAERPMSDDEAVGRFAELFEDSLKLRMRSDVPVGTLLSGGLDSSTIVCALRELGLIRPGMFESFSAVFEDDRFSERRYGELAVERAGLKPHWIYPNVEDVESHLDQLLYHMEQPFRSLAVYSQHLLYRAVRAESNIKVLLNGQGADELFGGYTRHYYVLFGHLLAVGRWGAAFDEMRRFSSARGIPFARVIRNTLGHVKAAVGRSSYLNQTTFAELSGSALREYLAYDDRNSMASSVEARVPFLDYRLVEFAFELTAEHKIRRFTNKRVVREYARSIVPQQIVDRTDKMGFVSPQEVWQREQLATVMRESRTALAGWVDSGFFDGRADLLGRMDRYLGSSDSVDWAFAWRVHCLDRWLRYEGQTV